PCSLPVEPGSCKGSHLRWYYNQQTQICEDFTYTGCFGNPNRFLDKSTCERKCNVVTDQDILRERRPPRCTLEKDGGPCRAQLPKYYFNSASGQCESFIYGGCRGNENRFDSEKRCEETCVSIEKASPQAVCSLPRKEGRCRAYILQWHYDEELNFCTEFYYGGCDGNANRFNSQEECQALCSGFAGGDGVGGQETLCEQRRSQSLQGSRGQLGRYVAQCKQDGRFEPLQCHQSTGFCWCVDDNGEERQATRSPPGTQKPNCEGHKEETLCNRKYQSALEDVQALAGRYIPQCTAEGEFQPMQCDPSSGFCWCVDGDGNDIPDTKLAPPDRPTCTKENVGQSNCRRQRQQALGIPGALVPECTDSGKFTPIQCQGADCWCVNENGDEIIGTRRGPEDARPDCQDEQPDDTPCRRQYIEAIADSEFIVGLFIPQCTQSGEFESTQCHGSTGYCWCVTDNGEEIPNTRRSPNEDQVICQEVPRGDTECHRQRSHALSNLLPGQIVPQCAEETGGFLPRQCWANSGYCWCVNELGKEVPGTRTGPHDPRPECDKYQPKRDTLCRSLRADALVRLYPDQFIYECTQDGDFEPLQCYGFTGSCWCVNQKGEEVTATRSTRYEPAPDCEAYRPLGTPCLRHREEARNSIDLGGRAYIPACRDDGFYSEIQCYSGQDAGYCWCVDYKGQEISGTRTLERGKTPNCKGTTEPEYTIDSGEVEGSGSDEDDVISVIIPGIIDDCRYAPHGCCPDHITPANGPNFFGCPTIIAEDIEVEIAPVVGDCRSSPYGCCSDGRTPASGPGGIGCPVVEKEPDTDSCRTTFYGCCPDRVRAALGPGYLGCPGVIPEEVDREVIPIVGDDCLSTPYGCCPDRITVANGPGGIGCPKIVEEEIDREGVPVTGGDCRTTPYGCCADDKTPANGPGFIGCPPVVEDEIDREVILDIGSDCRSTFFGCCPDGVTVAGFNNDGCPSVINEEIDREEEPVVGENCNSTPYGCCSDGITPASGFDFYGCVEDEIDVEDSQGYGCVTTRYGCCLDGINAALGANLFGCPGARPASVIPGPSDITVDEGDSITLQCSASGLPKPQVEWMKGSYKINDLNIDNLIDIGNGSFTIRDIAAEDAGIYACSAYNGLGQPAIYRVFVTVLVPVEIQEGQSVVTASRGETVQLKCHATGVPKPNVYWHKGSVRLPAGIPRFSQIQDDSLEISSVSLSDAGDYVCTGVNNVGTIQKKTITLVVHADVDIISGPLDITATVGDIITLTCQATGSPPPSIKWSVNGVPVAKVGRFIVQGNGDLYITSVHKSDSGVYTCTAANGRNTVSASSEVTVTGAPVDPNCKDDSEFANCKLILAGNFCSNKYYARFCCKTCSDNGFV
ncbi:uncharacterized protein LOC100329048, partial [Saccoglossus kowalevskii]|uniref:Uncharacterized protein LOC100329048 n=1 Tax=Saccoglossus kowalevskii TaxID=10224 RepID=A0ABM0GQ84_SACKO